MVARGTPVRAEEATTRSGFDVAVLVLRVVAGLAMAYHGWQKLDGGVSNFAGFVRSENIPLPALTAWVVTLLELVGGVLVAIGLLTRFWAALLAVEMVLTTLVVKNAAGLVAPQGGGAGFEVDLLYAAAFAALVLLGPGRLSVDHVAGIDRPGRWGLARGRLRTSA